MRRLGASLRARPRRALVTLVVIALAVTAAFVSVGGDSAPDLPTVEIVKGEFVDALEIRGDIKPAKSVVLAAPMQAGELQLVKLAKNGAMVRAGDIVIEFDGSTLRRTMQEKQSELKQSEAEIEQTLAQARITKEQNATELMKAQYNIERAKLDVQRGDTVSRIETEGAKLSLQDAEQRLRELEAKIKSDEASMEADLSTKRRKREKALFDLKRAQYGLERLQAKAPVDGMVNILPNYRSGSPFGGGTVEFREGDRAWPGAAILELPDLSTVHLIARLEEADRGRLSAGQEAAVRISAIPGREFKAKIEDISVLAKADYSSWPPTRQFELDLVLVEIDPKIRPGMSAIARIVLERIPDVVLVPTENVFQRDGYPVVYRLDGSQFVEQRIEVKRRGREQTIVGAGVEPGDRIATRKPGPELIRRTQ